MHLDVWYHGCYLYSLKLSLFPSSNWASLFLFCWTVDTTTLLVSDICWEELPLLSSCPLMSPAPVNTPSTPHSYMSPITGQCVDTLSRMHTMPSSFSVTCLLVLSPKLIPKVSAFLHFPPLSCTNLFGYRFSANTR